LAVGYLAQEREAGDRSGGEETRAALAAILRDGPEVLLLDEPTNDLDFAGLAWLERSLASHPGSVVVVSHDRAFLDRVVTRIVELDEWTRGTTEYSAGSRTRSSSGAPSGSGRSTSRSAGATGSPSPGRTAAARRRCWTPCSAGFCSLPAAAGSARASSSASSSRTAPR